MQYWSSLGHSKVIIWYSFDLNRGHSLTISQRIPKMDTLGMVFMIPLRQGVKCSGMVFLIPLGQGIIRSGMVFIIPLGKGIIY